MNLKQFLKLGPEKNRSGWMDLFINKNPGVLGDDKTKEEWIVEVQKIVAILNKNSDPALVAQVAFKNRWRPASVGRLKVCICCAIIETGCRCTAETKFHCDDCSKELTFSTYDAHEKEKCVRKVYTLEEYIRTKHTDQVTVERIKKTFMKYSGNSPWDKFNDPLHYWNQRASKVKKLIAENAKATAK